MTCLTSLHNRTDCVRGGGEARSRAAVVANGRAPACSVAVRSTEQERPRCPGFGPAPEDGPPRRAIDEKLSGCPSGCGGLRPDDEIAAHAWCAWGSVFSGVARNALLAFVAFLPL